jgi:hypothetical protein
MKDLFHAERTRRSAFPERAAEGGHESVAAGSRLGGAHILRRVT